MRVYRPSSTICQQTKEKKETKEQTDHTRQKVNEEGQRKQENSLHIFGMTTFVHAENKKRLGWGQNDTGTDGGFHWK